MFGAQAFQNYHSSLRSLKISAITFLASWKLSGSIVIFCVHRNNACAYNNIETKNFDKDLDTCSV